MSGKTESGKVSRWEMGTRPSVVKISDCCRNSSKLLIFSYVKTVATLRGLIFSLKMNLRRSAGGKFILKVDLRRIADANVTLKMELRRIADAISG